MVSESKHRTWKDRQSNPTSKPLYRILVMRVLAFMKNSLVLS
jgi:hypothetical protein